MRQRLLDLLRCPRCRGVVTAAAFVADRDEIVEGTVTCSCGASYPIVDTIPRMLENAYELFPAFASRYAQHLELREPEALPRGVQAELDRTQESFGYQWTAFSEMSCDFRDNFWNYLRPATPAFFQGRLGLDAGCGFGRHIAQAATNGAEMVGMDFSRAIDSSRANTKQLSNVYLVQGDIYAPPFAPDTFDFVYSVGVLHHLPDPERGVRSLVTLIKPDGTMFVWLYSKRRRVANAFLDLARTVTTRLPHGLVKQLSLIGALVDRYVFILPSEVARRTPGLRGAAERLTPPRIRLYAQYPFQVLHADWFDRLAAPIRFYYDGQEVDEILQRAGLADRLVEPTGLYGWRGKGVRALGGGGEHHVRNLR